MSAVLLEFAESYLDVEDELKRFEFNLALAAAAWNMSSLPQEGRAGQLESVFRNRLGDAHASAREMGRVVIHGLISRKEMYCPNDRRFIADFEMLEEAAGYHVNVISLHMGDMPGELPR